MNKQKRLSQYLDGLAKEDIKKIEGFPLPWQVNFLKRFYHQLQEKQLKKTDICDNINSDKNANNLLPDKYTLPNNTLTQFTNFNSSNMREVNVSNLIAVSNALDVSINYLLGIDNCETKENTDINKATGLENNTIEIIKNNKELQEKLNFFLQSPKLNDITKELDNEFYMQYISNNILNAYKEPLLNIIEKAYMKFNIETFPLDRTLKRYRDYLYLEIPYDNIKSSKIEPNKLLNYLKNNLCADRLNQIQIQIEHKNISIEKEIYDTFINDTAECTYEILEHKYNKDVRMNKISQSILSILDDYICTRQQALKNHFAKKCSL